MNNKAKIELYQIEEVLWILQLETGISNYDFDFKRYFNFKRRRDVKQVIKAVGRFGPISNYSEVGNYLKENLSLIHI